MKKLRYMLMQHINDQTIFMEDRFSLEAMFKQMAAPADLFAVVIACMILALAFFMMTVSFS